jgi:hypothetical protein
VTAEDIRDVSDKHAAGGVQKGHVAARFVRSLIWIVQMQTRQTLSFREGSLADCHTFPPSFFRAVRLHTHR